MNETTCVNHPETTELARLCSRCGVGFCDDCRMELAGHTYCGACKTQQLLDLRSGIDRSGLDLASRGRRFAALMIDAIPFLALGLFLPSYFRAHRAALGVPNRWMSGSFYTVLSIAYEGSMLQWRGQTLGKMAMKVGVVRPDGTPISRQQAWIRAVVHQVLSWLYVVDDASAFFTEQRTSLHDLAARTRVINWS